MILTTSLSMSVGKTNPPGTVNQSIILFIPLQLLSLRQIMTQDNRLLYYGTILLYSKNSNNQSINYYRSTKIHLHLNVPNNIYKFTFISLFACVTQHSLTIIPWLLGLWFLVPTRHSFNQPVHLFLKEFRKNEENAPHVSLII